MTLNSSSNSSSNVPSQSSQDVTTTAPSKTANNTTSEIGASTSLVKFIDLARWEHNNDNHYHWEGKVSLKDLPRIYALGDEHHDNDQSLDMMLDIQKKGDVVFWQLHTTGVLWQTCQRCLDPVAVSLDVPAMAEIEVHQLRREAAAESALIICLARQRAAHQGSVVEDAGSRSADIVD